MIRQATSDDLPLVRELLNEFEREIPDELWPVPAAHDAVLVAGDVGLVTLVRKSERIWRLEVLYVRPAARGGGVGGELLRAAAEHVQAQGGEMLALDVLESNDDARRFYDRLGFKTVERVLAAPVARLVGGAPSGPTFGAVHVQTDDVEKVRRDAAKALRAEPDVRLGSGWVRVQSDATDADPARLRTLGRELSYTTGGVVLALGVEDGAVVRYTLYDRGAAIDEYLSVPEHFGSLPPGDVIALGSNPTAVARLTGADPKRVREVARTAASAAELPPAQELYEQIASVMGVEP